MIKQDYDEKFHKINQAISEQRLEAEPRSESNTTKTILEEFAQTTFAPAFRESPTASFADKFGGFFLRSYLLLAGNSRRAD